MLPVPHCPPQHVEPSAVVSVAQPAALPDVAVAPSAPAISVPRAGSPHPSAALLSSIESIVYNVLVCCTEYRQRCMGKEADGVEAERKSSSQQSSQRSDEVVSGSDNDGDNEDSGLQSSRGRKRKRKAAGSTQSSCLVLRYASSNDVFNQQTRQYEQWADGGQSEEHPSDESIEELSQRVQAGLQRQRAPMTSSAQHTLRFPFPLTGAAHCGQPSNNSQHTHTMQHCSGYSWHTARVSVHCPPANVICTLSLVYSILVRRQAQSLRSLYYEQVGLVNNQLEINRGRLNTTRAQRAQLIRLWRAHQPSCTISACSCYHGVFHA